MASQDSLVLLSDDLSNSPSISASSKNRLLIFDNDWPQPVISDSETERALKKAKRRIKKDANEIQQDNLTTIFKLVCKELMDSSLVHGRLLDDEFVPLQQFFIILENILLHNLKNKKLSLLGAAKEFYTVLEQIQRFSPDAAGISTTVREMSHLKTSLGKARAWLRLAMMRKKLPEYFKVLVERKDVLSEFYDAGAIVLLEDAHILCGLMLGLNCIDCHLNIKGNTGLDEPISPIDYSLYLSEASLPGPDIDCSDSASTNEELSVALDQNRFLEEHNYHLTTALQETKLKLADSQVAHDQMLLEFDSTKILLKDLQTENALYRTENKRLAFEYDKRLQASEEDVQTERETYQVTREGLEQMYTECQKRLREEIKLRQEMEKEAELQTSMRSETEIATRLLERDVHEKQDLIIALRHQLDDVKGYNIEMYSKQQILEAKLKEKTAELKKLEDIIQAAKSEKDRINNKLKQSISEQTTAQEMAASLALKLESVETKRLSLETDLRIEREWRATLKESLERADEKALKHLAEIARLKETETNYNSLKIAHEGIQKLVCEQEITLAEMALQLGSSKLKHEDLREVQQALHAAHWADDDQVAACHQCHSPFNLARRKHHCRNCGHIFCNECSDQKMALPSSAKPVRVCDGCQVILLSRANKGS